jgi:hypothetical protein
MSRKSLRWVVVACFLWSQWVMADDKVAESHLNLESHLRSIPLEEAYILLQRGSNTGDMFYRVQMDDQEQPYLDIADILDNWLGLVPSCDLELNRCETTIHYKKQTFWIDGNLSQFGDTKENTSPVPFPQEALVRKDDKLWLRHDIWQQWLPVTAHWNLSQYRLRMDPRFLIKEYIDKSRAEIRKRSKQQFEERQRIDSLRAIYPEGGFYPEIRYRLSHEVFSKYEMKQSTASLDLNLDLWQGTLKMNNTFSRTTQNDNETDYTQTLWNYRRHQKTFFQHFELGNMPTDYSLLIPQTSVENGFKLHRLRQKTASDQLGFSGSAPPGTEIDFYYNGFIIDSLVVGEEGVYSFKEVYVPGGDLVHLRFYYLDGSSKEETIQVAPDNGWLLPSKNWNTRFFHGEADIGALSRFDVGYGFSEDFSFGLQGIQITPEDEDTRDFTGAFMVWRPFYGLYLLAEGLNSENGTSDYAASIDITAFYPQFLKLEYAQFDENSLLKGIQKGDRSTTEFKRATHNLSISRWLLITEVTDTSEKRKTKLNIRRHITSRVSAFAESSNETLKTGTSIDSYSLGTDFSGRRHSVQGKRSIVGESGSWLATYRYMGPESFPWQFSASIRKPDEGETSFTATLSWQPTNNITVRAYQRSDNDSVMASWSDIIAFQPGPKNWNDFSGGTLTGRVVAPKIEDHPPAPLSGVEIKAGSKRGVTDQDGYYVISGLPVEQRVKVSVSASTLDIGLTPAEDVAIAYFRPGTRIEYHPLLINTVGLDGYFEFGESVPLETVIEVYRLSDKKMVATVPVEMDGFFVIEGLIPGTYDLMVKGTGRRIQPYQLELKKGDVWVSDILIPLLIE